MKQRRAEQLGAKLHRKELSSRAGEIFDAIFGDVPDLDAKLGGLA